MTTPTLDPLASPDHLWATAIYLAAVIAVGADADSCCDRLERIAADCDARADAGYVPRIHRRDARACRSAVALIRGRHTLAAGRE